MPCFPNRPMLALLGLLALPCLALGACTPTATATFAPPPAATLGAAPTPTNVPAGWTVLVGHHVSIAFPPGWTLTTNSPPDGSEFYTIAPPDARAPSVRVVAAGPVTDPHLTVPYCLPVSTGAQRTTLAGLPMTYLPSGDMRSWSFVNVQRRDYTLGADDVQSDAATQAQDDAILATFRPDNADPWHCSAPTPTNVPAG